MLRVFDNEVGTISSILSSEEGLVAVVTFIAALGINLIGMAAGEHPQNLIKIIFFSFRVSNCHCLCPLSSWGNAVLHWWYECGPVL